MYSVSQSVQKIFLIKHSKVAYMVDFAVYFFLIIWMISDLIFFPISISTFYIALYIGLGGLSWTLIEYVLHRWVLHLWYPFSEWHNEHHQQPRAFICTATLVSLSAIAMTVYLPLYLWASAEVARCFTLGVLIGYVTYAVTHHAIHHWLDSNVSLLKRRQGIHSLHHASPNHAFGVTSSVWDHLLGTALKPQAFKRSLK